MVVVIVVRGRRGGRGDGSGSGAHCGRGGGGGGARWRRAVAAVRGGTQRRSWRWWQRMVGVAAVVVHSGCGGE